MKSLVLAYMIVPAVAAATGFTAAQKMTDPAPPSTYLNAVVVSTDVGAKTVTVRPKGGQSRTLHVDDEAAGRPGPLTPPGAPPVPTPPAPPTLHPGPSPTPTPGAR